MRRTGGAARMGLIAATGRRALQHPFQNHSRSGIGRTGWKRAEPLEMKPPGSDGARDGVSRPLTAGADEEELAAGSVKTDIRRDGQPFPCRLKTFLGQYGRAGGPALECLVGGERKEVGHECALIAYTCGPPSLLGVPKSIRLCGNHGARWRHACDLSRPRRRFSAPAQGRLLDARVFLGTRTIRQRSPVSACWPTPTRLNEVPTTERRTATNVFAIENSMRSVERSAITSNRP